MSALVRRRLVVLLVILALVFPARPARADEIKNEVIVAVVAIVVVTAAITTAIVLSIRHHPSISGCVTDGPAGMQMVNEGDQTSFLLTGDTVGVKAGERVKLQGKKNGRDATGSRHFFVEKIKKDYGVCRVTP